MACGLTVEQRDDLVEVVNKIRREEADGPGAKSSALDSSTASSSNGAETLGHRVLREMQNHGGASKDSSGSSFKRTKSGEFSALLKRASAALEQRAKRQQEGRIDAEEEIECPPHLIEAIERRNDSRVQGLWQWQGLGLLLRSCPIKKW